MSAWAMTSCELMRLPWSSVTPMLHCRWNTCSCSTCFKPRMSSSTLRRGRARFVARHVAHQHDELVAAEPRQEVLGSHGVAQLLRRELQQVIAGRMTARVVDVLELVEVDEEQRAARVFVGAARELGIELGDEPMAIRRDP